MGEDILHVGQQGNKISSQANNLLYYSHFSNAMKPEKTIPSPSNKVVILDVAEQLFSEHGYRETTMANIAQQAGMSAANLYRHYQDKEDIAAACACRCLDRKNEALRAVLQNKRLGAAGLLEEFIVGLLRYTHQEMRDRPRMNEMTEVVIQSRPEVIHDMLFNLQSIVAEILAQGNASQEFAVDNVVATSETVFAAITVFFTPLFMHLYPLPEFERRARAMAKLLVRGLANR